MEKLVRYLLENIYIDFQGDIDLKTVKNFLRGEDLKKNHVAATLLAKLEEEDDVEDLLLTLADVLKPHIATGISDEVMLKQIAEYADS